MASLTNPAENHVLDWLTDNSPTNPTFPLKVALLTAAGSDSAAGTEVVAGGNTYARQNVTFGAAVSGVSSNTNEPTWNDLPACTIVGYAIYDSAGTPIRWAHGTLTTQRVIQAGDTAKFVAGSLTVTAD